VLGVTVKTILRVHRAWAWVVIVANGAVGLWGLGAQRLAALRGRVFWVSTSAAEACIAVQVILGVLLYSRGLRPPKLHIFYGVLLIAAPTLAWSIRSEPAIRRRIYLFYGLAGLFFMGLAIRALVTH
jgi:hypothetical protein